MGKKLLFIYYQNIKAGGVAKVLANLVNELVDEGYEIDILFLMRNHEDFYPIDSRVKKHYVDSFAHWAFSICTFNKKRLHFIPKIQSINDYIYQIGVTLVMNKWLGDHHRNYDNIISCWYKLSCTLAINKDVNEKTIAWEHISHKVGGSLYNRLKAKYKNLDQVVCLNEDDYDYYKAINPKSTIIGNMMDKEIESQLFIPSEKKDNLITMIARLDEEKNVLEFLEIIKESDLPTDWQVKVIGDGSQMSVLKDYINDNSLSNVSLLGQLNSDQVKDILSKSKISCLTSLREGFGVVLIEALFSSNALIAYDCPSGPSEIVNEKNGFLIPLRDKATFIDKLNGLVNDPNTLDSLMKSSFAESQKWKKDAIIEKWKNVLS
ncbi:glycosyltransferase [Chryseobacterium sp. FH1]|uniref:glycosyltransferase n=1 Tax=Chryseobacterium sp. FH1 TaxID=1233951 RepID=UPI0004E45490|nr:glycosyltransferase [Chryseobacterium sp. FH1]KFC24078.1 hypothetical protein IO90_01885 [Chryseobacterium sp. FH1]